MSLHGLPASLRSRRNNPPPLLDYSDSHIRFIPFNYSSLRTLDGNISILRNERRCDGVLKSPLSPALSSSTFLPSFISFSPQEINPTLYTYSLWPWRVSFIHWGLISPSFTRRNHLISLPRNPRASVRGLLGRLQVVELVGGH